MAPIRVTFANTGAALGAYAVVGGRPEPSAHLIRQLDDDPLQGGWVTRFGRVIHESGARS